MKIEWDITIEDLVSEYPKAVSILLKYGIKAMVCGEPIWGTLEEAAEKYNVKPPEKEKMLEELNKLANEGKGIFINFENK